MKSYCRYNTKFFPLYLPADRMETQKNNPLHGITLESILTYMVENHGWEFLADEVNINCFKSNPTMKSSLNFLRKTPWARAKVESLYLYLKRRERRTHD